MLVISFRFDRKDPASWIRLLFAVLLLACSVISFMRLNIDLIINGYSKFSAVMPIPVWGLVQLSAGLGLLLPRRENLVLAAAWFASALVFGAFSVLTTMTVGLNYGTAAYGLHAAACFLLMANTTEHVWLRLRWVQGLREAVQGRRDTRAVRGHGGD